MSALTVQRICKNTILGSRLGKQETDSIASQVLANFYEDEKIEIVYSHEDTFEKMNFSFDKVVLITNFRIIKIEENKCQSSLRKNIMINTLEHIKGGFFKWDKLKFKLSDGTEIEYGIYYNESCKYFCEYLKLNKCQDPEEKTKIRKEEDAKIKQKHDELVLKLDEIRDTTKDQKQKLVSIEEASKGTQKQLASISSKSDAQTRQIIDTNKDMSSKIMGNVMALKPDIASINVTVTDILNVTVSQLEKG